MVMSKLSFEADRRRRWRATITCTERNKAVHRIYQQWATIRRTSRNGEKPIIADFIKDFDAFIDWSMDQKGYRNIDPMSRRAFSMNTSILSPDVNIWDKETLVFVPQIVINIFSIKPPKDHELCNGLPCGIRVLKRNQRIAYDSHIRHPLEDVRYYLGSYNNKDEIFKEFARAKNAIAQSVAEFYKLDIDERVYDLLMKFDYAAEHLKLYGF